ncbi:Hypothetical predicted protein [Pelobates cultripes]|uniref:Uncharacterized protein n=1 Tax=Pelobates cultripes TaxID=61616 RepID=A0AAD1W9F6_PELCU|nr:Hypothetical predicted protein [Pelobates cultripes]
MSEQTQTVEAEERARDKWKQSTPHEKGVCESHSGGLCPCLLDRAVVLKPGLQLETPLPSPYFTYHHACTPNLQAWISGCKYAVSPHCDCHLTLEGDG